MISANDLRAALRGEGCTIDDEERMLGTISLESENVPAEEPIEHGQPHPWSRAVERATAHRKLVLAAAHRARASAISRCAGQAPGSPITITIRDHELVGHIRGMVQTEKISASDFIKRLVKADLLEKVKG